MPALSMFTLRALLEGKWPILILAALTVATVLWCPARGAWALPLILLLFTIAFFRDPDRRVPSDRQTIVAPADGRVVDIKTVHEPDFLKTDAIVIGIFLSVFDVHVQRAPVAGEIKLVNHKPGKFLDARHPAATTANESRVIGIETADGLRVAVRQIAGRIARRIVGWNGPGQRLERGERLGMIRFGSRVELLLPPGTEVLVKPGDYAWGGETIVARRK